MIKKISSPPPADVVRCVRAPDGRLIADFHQSVPFERPLWLGMRPNMLRRAAASDLASAWFGEPTLMDDRFITQCQTSSYKAVLSTLAMAHKSGACILGLESVMLALQEDVLRVVLIATDAGKSDQKKLVGNPHYASLCTHFATRQELGRVLGRHSQVYIGVCHGDIAEKLTGFLRCSTGFTRSFSL